MRIVLVLACWLVPAFALADATYVLKPSSGYIKEQSRVLAARGPPCLHRRRTRPTPGVGRGGPAGISVSADGVGYATGQNERYVADVTDVFASKATADVITHLVSAASFASAAEPHHHAQAGQRVASASR